MDNFEKLIERGRGLGQNGMELEDWVEKKMKQDEEREQRAIERDAKAKEAKANARVQEAEAKARAQEAQATLKQTELEMERLKLGKHEDSTDNG